MNNATAVAVVIPCYKQAHLLGDALRSCLVQEPAPAEVIVVDDGSPDNVAAAVAAVGDPRVRLLRRENGGLSAARNTGLVASSSPFLIFLDSDDTLRPGAIAAGLACHAANPGAAFVWGGYQNMDARGRTYGEPIARQLDGEPFAALLACNLVGMHAAVMYRRAPLLTAGGFDEALRAVEDWDMFVRLAEHHPAASHTAVVANYRRYDNSMSTDCDRMIRGGLIMLEHLRPAPGAPSAIRRAWRLGRFRLVARFMRLAVMAGLEGLRQGDVKPLLRATRTVARHAWFLLPMLRPSFAVSTARNVLRTTPEQASG